MTVCPPAALKLAAHAAAENKVFSLNISAPFIAQFFKDPLAQLMPYADILFGNETEAQAYADSQEWGMTDLKEIALKVAALPKTNSARSRIVRSLAF